MHHWDTVHETGTAPYPIVPTYRPDPPFKRRNPSMVSASPNSTRSTPRPQARSAGMAERATRNENLSDLVRFFQTQNMPTDTTTALPTVESPNRDQQLQQQQQPPPPQQEQQQQQQLKPFHRRLLQFTQRQKKDPSKPKLNDSQKQIEALQREGYLLGPPPPKQKGPKGNFDSSKGNIDRSLSTKKRDVETIGQPWLEDKSEGTSQPSTRRRLGSLDLGDFGSMVDVAVSLSEFDDSVPPPYQATSSTGHAPRSEQNIATRSTAAPRLPSSSSGGRSSSFDRPMSPTSSTVDVQHVSSRVDFASRRSSNSSIRIVDPDTNPSPRPKKNASLSVHTIESSSRSIKNESKPDQALGPPPRTPDRPPPNPPTTNAQPSLKLFPDVAPPRMSSKNAWRLSAVPRYQTAPSASSAPTPSAQPEASGPGKSSNAKREPSEAASAKGLKDDVDPVCSGALVTNTIPTENTTAEVTTSLPAVPPPKKARPPSLAMGTLKAFPLPAPTKPLPSVPKVGSAPTATADGKVNATIRPARSGLMVPSFQTSQPSPIPEDSRELVNRPATSLGYIGARETKTDDEDRSFDPTPARPKSTSPEQHTPKRRAASMQVGRMQELPESPPECSDQSTEGQPVADSPVLGQMTPTKPHGKRAASKGLQIDPRSERTNLPFGLPSPPPTASLPSDPPPYPPPDRPLPHRNFSAPTGSGVPSTKGLEMTFGPGLHRASMISRSDSSRSSLRQESIPESYKPSRPESPLPSSDEEGFAPGVGPSRPRRNTDKRSHLASPGRRGYETLDARSGRSRPQYPHSMRSLTPQSRSCHSLEKATSSQSQYSQSTHRSREPVGHHRAPQPENQASQFLEDRVANLERQNQILQAALMAALNAGIKNNMDDSSDSSSMSPALSAAGLANPYQSRFMSRPESWVSSSRSSENSGFETPASLRDSRANARQLDHMIEDIEAGWLSDKSSLSGARSMTRNR